LLKQVLAVLGRQTLEADMATFMVALRFSQPSTLSVKAVSSWVDHHLQPHRTVVWLQQPVAQLAA
jgi:hypothetical protein